MDSFIVKGRGKIRHVVLTGKKHRRIKRVLTLTAKGMEPKRYPQRCHGALVEWCTRCYTGTENRVTSAEQALKTLLQRSAGVNARG